MGVVVHYLYVLCVGVPDMVFREVQCDIVVTEELCGPGGREVQPIKQLSEEDNLMGSIV